jgi:hypothetical protein
MEMVSRAGRDRHGVDMSFLRRFIFRHQEVSEAKAWIKVEAEK